MNSVTRMIHKMMKRNGFKMARKNKHAVWKNGKNTITTGVSISDHRAHKNVESVLRKTLGAAFVE